MREQHLYDSWLGHYQKADQSFASEHAYRVSAFSQNIFERFARHAKLVRALPSNDVPVISRVNTSSRPLTPAFAHSLMRPNGLSAV